MQICICEIVKISLMEYEQHRQNVNSILFSLEATRRYSPAFCLHCEHIVQRVCTCSMYCISHRQCWSWSHFCWDRDRPSKCHISCLQFEPLEESECVSPFECPSQQVQQLLMLLEGTVFSPYEVSPVHYQAAPGKFSIGSVFPCSSPCLFHTTS